MLCVLGPHKKWLQDQGHHFAQLDRIFTATQGSASKEDEAQSGYNFEHVSSHKLLFMFQNAKLQLCLLGFCWHFFMFCLVLFKKKKKFLRSTISHNVKLRCLHLKGAHK